MLLLDLDCWSSRKIRSFFWELILCQKFKVSLTLWEVQWSLTAEELLQPELVQTDGGACVCVCVSLSPWSVTSDGSKRIEASSWGNGSRRQNVWYPTRWVKARARITWPQGVDYHPTTAARPEEGRRSSEIQEKDTCQLVLFTVF